MKLIRIYLWNFNNTANKLKKKGRADVGGQRQRTITLVEDINLKRKKKTPNLIIVINYYNNLFS